MQSVSSRIWTRVAVSISYDDNNYTTGTLSLSTIVSQKFCNILVTWDNSAAPDAFAKVVKVKNTLECEMLLYTHNIYTYTRKHSQ